MSKLNELLGISANKVAHVIVHSRGAGVKTGSWEEDADPDTYTGTAGEEADAGVILEDGPGDLTRQELHEFLDTLDEDEQAALVALAWIGRGTYAPAELEEAVSAARAKHRVNASAYLFGLPLLSDYLEDALGQFGISASAGEEVIVQPVSI
jgi:Protein of unknown function (DUF3775)